MRTTDTKRFSIAARLWGPTIGLAVVLALSGTGTALRTVKLPAEAREAQTAQTAQTAQQEALELAWQWHGLAEAKGSRRLAAAVGGEAAATALQADIADGQARLSALQRPLQQQRITAMRDAAAAERMRTVWSVTGLMALIVTVLAVSTIFLMRTICRPLRRWPDAVAASLHRWSARCTRSVPASRRWYRARV